MQLLKQPNRWSCGATSLAMVLGISYDQVIKEIGHDGSEIIYPKNKEPLNRRGFHHDEFQQVAMRRGYCFIVIDALPQTMNKETDEPVDVYSDRELREQHLFNLIANSRGIIIGREAADKPHAVAYLGEKLYDPTPPVIVDLYESSFTIEHILILNRLASTIPECGKCHSLLRPNQEHVCLESNHT